MINIIKNLKKYGYILPSPILPIANYSPFIITGKLIFISGQIPIENNKISFLGKLGKDLDLISGKKAAKLCILNTFSILNMALKGDLNKVKKCVKLTVFVNSVDDFYKQPEVADGASNIIKEIFEKNSDHSRSAVSANSLPRNVAVEIDSIFELEVEK